VSLLSAVIALGLVGVHVDLWDGLLRFRSAGESLLHSENPTHANVVSGMPVENVGILSVPPHQHDAFFSNKIVYVLPTYTDAYWRHRIGANNGVRLVDFVPRFIQIDTFRRGGAVEVMDGRPSMEPISSRASVILEKRNSAYVEDFVVWGICDVYENTLSRLIDNGSKLLAIISLRFIGDTVLLIDEPITDCGNNDQEKRKNGDGQSPASYVAMGFVGIDICHSSGRRIFD
jgi:hypothetical protein